LWRIVWVVATVDTAGLRVRFLARGSFTSDDPRNPAVDSGRTFIGYTCVKRRYMSDAERSTGNDGPETVQINLRLTQAFLDDIDATWKHQGFNSRSEFLRHAARDAIKHPEFSREGWKQIAASEHELRTGDEELVSRADVIAAMDDDSGADGE